jgi:hypothetical protein
MMRAKQGLGTARRRSLRLQFAALGAAARK